MRINQESAEFILSEMDSPLRRYAVTTEVTFVAEGMSFDPDKQ